MPELSMRFLIYCMNCLSFQDFIYAFHICLELSPKNLAILPSHISKKRELGSFVLNQCSMNSCCTAAIKIISIRRKSIIACQTTLTLMWSNALGFKALSCSWAWDHLWRALPLILTTIIVRSCPWKWKALILCFCN